MNSPQRIAIIGAGHVGAAAAYALMLRGLVGEIVLIDSDPALAEAEAADLADANAMARPVRIWAGSYEDAAGAQIAVLAAGAATHQSQSRLSVASASAEIVGGCVSRLAGAGFAGILLVAANPVDLMSLIAFRQAGLPAARVIGTGTLLDSRRLAQRLADRLDVDPRSIDCHVLGEHGDSEVAAFSTARVGGLTLEAFAAPAPMTDHQALADRVRKDGYRIIAGKGSTSWGIATAIVRICEAILRDERAVLPVSTLLTGQFGIDGLYLSLPCVLGASGVERVLEPPLTRRETMDLQASATALRNALPLVGVAKAS
ncbi:L-lactate dehydrogenase [Caulobacter ginsengisoli]|uniref:L-lactate dehydrogenase n=1 Tax=Caulobacter ginsengisoli TaxID=400775 RepID=A0ABU0IRE3_9CAUL|nr:L-lactate dehydrogenase [Caulobacter ginsengisoli]MDQ0463517.1 L-lactate dehydrogenase [Caulobacter ginsengisoli]